jgi:hypothetical protein
MDHDAERRAVALGLEIHRGRVRKKIGPGRLARIAAKAKMPIEAFVNAIAAWEKQQADAFAAWRARRKAKPENPT